MASSKYGEEPENEDLIGRKIRRLDIDWYLRSPYLWGLIVAAVCVFGFFIWPFGSSNWHSWSTGPLNSGHSMLSNNCFACHAKSFNAVEDSSCNACHQVSEHGSQKNKIPPAHNAETLGLKRCADCHVEHKSSREFKTSNSMLCSECHSNLSAVVSKPGYESFDSLKNHSEFSVTHDSKRIRLDNKAELKDSNTLKFNHAIHLKPDLKGRDGKVTLQCDECHKFPRGSQEENTVTFEKNCRSCHELSFDDRLPKSLVPHGNSEAVYQFMLAEYAKFFGLDLGRNNQPITERLIPGKNQTAAEPGPALVDSIVNEARSSEKVLFTKTACQLCHEISEKTDYDKLQSRFEVKKPKIPKKWFAKAGFLPSSHEIVSCESCHKGVSKSKDTSDVMLPGIDNCRSCHVDMDQAGLVPSDCATCHEYHGSMPLDSESKKPLEELLKSFTQPPQKW